MALPLARLVLPGFPACQCQPRPPLRFPKHHVSFAAPASSRAAFAACAAASAPAAPAAQAPEAETVEQVGPRTRLVAQNIPWDSTADEMRALFQTHGSVVGVEVDVCFSPFHPLWPYLVGVKRVNRMQFAKFFFLRLAMQCFLQKKDQLYNSSNGLTAIEFDSGC
jgi:hypothetical protein